MVKKISTKTCKRGLRAHKPIKQSVLLVKEEKSQAGIFFIQRNMRFKDLQERGYYCFLLFLIGQKISKTMHQHIGFYSIE